VAVFSQAEATLHKASARSHAHSSVWVTSREAFFIALETLRTHKLRTTLTLLGVVIATTTLIVVMSVINGMNLYIADHIANLGANTFILSQFQWAQGEEAWLKARRRNKPIRMADYEFLKANLKGYKAMGATGSIWPRPGARYQGKTIDEVSLLGATASMVDIGGEQVEYGRFISEADERHSAPVCFIGQDLVTQFFSNVDPLGKEIYVSGMPFEVIGVAKKIGTTFGQSQDNFVFLPLTTFKKDFLGRPGINVSVQAWNAQQMSLLEDEVRVLMRVRHHLPYKEDDDFGINASDTIMGLWQKLTGSIFAITIAVVAVFMVVGGIVIMNIMLASVTERTHEIGIRKSLGARRRDILTQFVMEASVMAALGGALGVLLAELVSMVVNHFFASSMPLRAILVGLVLSTGVGLFFGIYPASQAAKLDPIEALRTEN
jgi:putative ABC transport system permease protein